MTTARLIALALLAALPALAGCGTGGGAIDGLSAFNPFRDKPVAAEGDRRPILEVSDPARGVVGGTAKIGAAIARADWPQAGGSATNDPGNVAGTIKGVHYWSLKAGSSDFGSRYMGLSSSRGTRVFARPVARDGYVYILDAAGTVSAYKIANGGGAWHVGVYPDGKSAPIPGGGLAAAPGKVVASTGYREVVAIDPSTSSILWRALLDAPARSAPAVGAGKVVVTTQAGTVQAFDLDTGKAAWKASMGGSSTSLLASVSPALTADAVVVAGAGGEIVAFDLASGAEKWQAAVTAGDTISAVSGLSDASAAPVVDGGTVYATGVVGALIAVDARTGAVLWRLGLGSADAPVVSGGSLFFVDLESRMIAVDAKSGKVIWASALPPLPGSRARATWAGPVMAAGSLWVSSTDGRIAAVDARTGTLGTVTTLGFGGAIAPILASGKMLLLAGDGTLVAVN